VTEIVGRAECWQTVAGLPSKTVHIVTDSTFGSGSQANWQELIIIYLLRN